jgi:hypothetical protein
VAKVLQVLGAWARAPSAAARRMVRRSGTGAVSVCAAGRCGIIAADGA